MNKIPVLSDFKGIAGQSVNHKITHHVLCVTELRYEIPLSRDDTNHLE